VAKAVAIASSDDGSLGLDGDPAGADRYVLPCRRSARARERGGLRHGLSSQAAKGGRSITRPAAPIGTLTTVMACVMGRDRMRPQPMCPSGAYAL